LCLKQHTQQTQQTKKQLPEKRKSKEKENRGFRIQEERVVCQLQQSGWQRHPRSASHAQ
jgi:hypothetical protein